jgi:myo-inositol-1(or 4)-monophosphatase
MEIEGVLAVLADAATAAGAAAASYFRRGAQTSAEVSYKSGDSPVSEADIAANRVLERMLRDAFPDYGWISEETVDGDARLKADRIFIADPIDGTRAFIAGDANWCVSVALAEHGHPVAGVVHAPELGLTFTASRGAGAFCNDAPIRCSDRTALEGSAAAGPRPLLDRLEMVMGQRLLRGPKTPSLALRLVQAANGVFDIALASDGAHDWDIAAADVILREAGGVLLDAGGLRPVYNTANLRRGLLVAGSPELARAAVSAFGLRS